MNEIEQTFDDLRNVDIKKPTALTVKRPIGVLRYNAEIMRDNGATQKDIEDYLYDNGADINLIMSVPMPKEHEVNRMIEKEQSGEWAKTQQRSQELAQRSENSRKNLETLQNIQGGVRSFGNGLFLNYGDELESAMTGQDIDQIREEQEAWSGEHPYWDLALGLAGGMAPVLATGAGGALATGGAAGKSAAVRTGLGAAYGAGTGALAGFGGGTGGFYNRLEGAGYGSLYGGGIGATMPLAIGGVGRAVGRIARGFGKAPTEKQINDFVVDKIIAETGKSGGQAKRNASLLLQGIQQGDDRLQDAATNINRKVLAMESRTDPLTVDMALNPSWSPETASARQIVSGMTTPSAQAARKEFAEFVSKQTPVDAGDQVYAFVKNNNDVKGIISANKKRLGLESLSEREIKEKLGTYEGMQNLSEMLRLHLPEKPDLNLVDKFGRIKDALDDFNNLRNSLYPGLKEMNAKYAASVGGVQDVAERETKAYLSQLASGVAYPTNIEFSLTGASKLGLSPYVRGRARELVLKGALEPDNSSTIENILQKAGFNLYRTLEQQN